MKRVEIDGAMVESTFFVGTEEIQVDSGANRAVAGAATVSAPEVPLAKPEWLKVRVRHDESFMKVKEMLRAGSMHTVCEEAKCPNISECWQKGHATVMILGDTCTRACAFCNVKTGRPNVVDRNEPGNIAKLVQELCLKHVVITSVDRDDLPDGGAGQFVECINAIRQSSPAVTIEVLTPDFLKKGDVYKLILDAGPDVFNHNIETVPRLYPRVKQGARYFNSLNLLHSVKKSQPSIFTKSGIIVGLGESDEEIFQTMDDLRAADVDFITIGQYLQPTKKHVMVDRYVRPETFNSYKQIALSKGFLMVSSTPLTRSSYHAGDDFARLREARRTAMAQC